MEHSKLWRPLLGFNNSAKIERTNLKKYNVLDTNVQIKKRRRLKGRK